ncbi:MAG: hypothetical protein QNJ72_44105 [Pleurocapsa sp. MO_226.B13]|nr:hypothetical protein [Pleurocapsa sp. MO_226.B13]
MKLNLPKLLLTAGLSLGMLSVTSVAESRLSENSSSLSGQITDKQLPQQFKRMSSNGSSLSWQTTEKRLPQQYNGLPVNGSSLTGQISQKQQKR